MTVSAVSRNLTVLVVDDQASLLLARPGSAAALPLDFRYIASWAQAQSLCASSGDMGGADILLIDVSFETDSSLEKVLSSGEKILPAGPLLALPFISKRSVMSCVCYSAHIANPQLQVHPWFLMAMGLILARSTGIPGNAPALHSAHLSNGSKVNHLDTEIRRLAGTGCTSQNSALVAGLMQYRSNLIAAIKQGSAVLTNRNVLMHELNKLAALTDFEVLSRSLASLSICLVGANWRDQLSVQSLFADALKPADDWEASDALQEIRQWLNGIPSPTPIEWAFKALDAQEEDQRRRPVRETLIEVAGRDAPSFDLTEALRLCVLFANVWAIYWGDGSAQPPRQSVLDRLEPEMDINTYFGWFGERDKHRPQSSDKRPVKREVPHSAQGTFGRLSPLSQGQTRQDRCLLTAGVSALSPADKDAISKYCAYERMEMHRSPLFPDLVQSEAPHDPS